MHSSSVCCVSGTGWFPEQCRVLQLGPVHTEVHIAVALLCQRKGLVVYLLVLCLLQSSGMFHVPLWLRKSST